MELQIFKEYKNPKFAVGDSFAIIGKSQSGKSTVVEQLLSHFSENFAEKIEHCRTIVILYREMQVTYQRLLNLFPNSCRKILARHVDREWLESSFWTCVYQNEQDYSIIIFDDMIEQLAGKQSLELDLLSNLIFIGLHHSRAILIVTLQSLGMSDTSQKLRMIVKQFAIFVLMTGLPSPTIRYLNSFLSPFKSSVLTTLMNGLPKRPGSYCVIDNRLIARHKFLCNSILSRKDQIFMVFD